MNVLKVKFSITQIAAFILIDLITIAVLILLIFFPDNTPLGFIIAIICGLSMCFFTPYIIFAIKYRIFVYDDKIKSKTIISEKEYNHKDITFVLCQNSHYKGVTTKYYNI